MALPVGTKLQNGHYVVGRTLGEGGFGMTYLAHDRQLGRLVAIKEFFLYGSGRHGLEAVPPAELPRAAYDTARTRFLDEARIVAGLDHPGIVRVYHFFEENHTAYMVMEHLDGQTLQAMLDSRADGLPIDEALGYVRQVGSALAAVHAAGVLHRDLKPDNIIITRSGRAVLLDFGTARQYTAGLLKRMTAFVTPGYAPPEQYTTQSARGPATDVYALAATLYHLLSGQVPLEALDRLAGHTLLPLNTLRPDVPAAVSDAVMAALSMEPTARPQSVEVFLQALSPQAAPLPAVVSSVPPPTGTPSAATTAAVPGMGNSAAPTAPAPATNAFSPWDPQLPQVTAGAVLRGHKAWVKALDFNPEGDWLASGAEDQSVRLWDVTHARELHRLDGHCGFIGAVRFAPDGKTLASASFDRTVRLWNMGTHSMRRQLSGRDGALSVEWSPDSRVVAAGFRNGSVLAWNVESGTEVFRFDNSAGAVWALRLSPAAPLLAVALGLDGDVMLWDVTSRQQRAMLVGHGGAVRALAFNHDGSALATASSDGTVRLWNTAEARETACLRSHRSAVWSVVFCGDSGLLASGSADKTIRLWDVAQACEVHHLEAHQGDVSALAYSPARHLLASASKDETIRLWQLPR